VKVLNIHTRTINSPKQDVVNLLETLSSENDLVWPIENWPTMKFEGGIMVGAKGGHGPIRYSVEKYKPSSVIQFRFSRPLGFNGIHKFEIKAISNKQTEVTHFIDMKTDLRGTVIWLIGVKSLHNALVEDGLDKLENHFSDETKSQKWNLWVRILRFLITGNRRKK
jgi:hypothetical protein